MPATTPHHPPPTTTTTQVGAPDKAREAPLALKALYDADLADEDIILAWHEKEDAAKVSGRGWGWGCLGGCGPPG